MYDFRIHAQTGKPYLLETGLFWSFSEASMISTMLQAQQIGLESITASIWKQTTRRKGKVEMTL
ncbi:MAG: hypothetical protein AAF573_21200 [Bacteroidota bacterium]